MEQENHKEMAIGFLLLIGLGSLVLFFTPSRQFSPQENRYLTQKPKLTIPSLGSGQYMKNFEKYVTDQFAGRDFWVSFKATCERLSLKPENNQVYFGAQGYLMDKLIPVDEKILNKNLLSVTKLAAAGYDVKLLLSPTAAEVLEDKLPAYGYLPYQRQMLEKVKANIEPGIYIDLLNLFQQKRAEQPLYYRTDHHWTSYGAYLAYGALMESRQAKPLPLEAWQVETVSRDFYGTLWSKNSLPTIEPDCIQVFRAWDEPAYQVSYNDGNRQWQSNSVYAPNHLSTKDQYGYFLDGNNPLTVIKRLSQVEPAADQLGKLLIFKDSFAHALIPFLIPHYEEIHVLDLRYYKQDPIKYLEENQIGQVLFLYSAVDFGGDSSIGQVGFYLK